MPATIHGDDDRNVFFSQSVYLVEALRDNTHLHPVLTRVDLSQVALARPPAPLPGSGGNAEGTRELSAVA